jgi:hypothetical protein
MEHLPGLACAVLLVQSPVPQEKAKNDSWIMENRIEGRNLFFGFSF